MKEKLTKNEIEELIPHREPFLFLDELINIKKLQTATGIKTFSAHEEFFKGHFGVSGGPWMLEQNKHCSR